MWTRQLLKKNGKEAFRRNYWKCVLASFLIGLLVSGTTGINFNFNEGFEAGFDAGYSDNVYPDIAWADIVRTLIFLLPVIIIGILIGLAIAIAISAFLCNIIEIGGKRYYLENRERQTSVSKVFDGFSNGHYMSSVKTMFFRSLYIFGWSLLFVIPGIVKSYEYSMIPYLLAENPSLSKERAFELSRQMMDGHKMEAFILGWSFFGWILLTAFTGGLLGLFYVNPYVHATYAEFYSAVKAEAFQKGLTNPMELPGV